MQTRQASQGVIRSLVSIDHANKVLYGKTFYADKIGNLVLSVRVSSGIVYQIIKMSRKALVPNSP